MEMKEFAERVMESITTELMEIDSAADSASIAEETDNAITIGCETEDGDLFFLTVERA